MLYFGKGFRSFHTGNIESVCQRASKLLDVKVGVLKKKSASLAIPAQLCASTLGPCSSLPRVKSFSNFDEQQFCSPLTHRPQIFCIERYKPFQGVSKVQEAILRVDLALTK